jgi:hypothetical protein
MPLWGLGIAAGIGVVKDELVDQPMYKKQLQLAAATQKYSPWTGNKANVPTQPSALGSALSMGTAGAMAGMQYDNSKAYQNFMNNQGNWSPTGAAPVTPDNLSQSTPEAKAMNGPNPYASPQSDASSAPMLGSTPAGPGFSQPTASASQVGPGDAGWYQDPYATLKDRGYSLQPPSYFWSPQTNPYMMNNPGNQGGF